MRLGPALTTAARRSGSASTQRGMGSCQVSVLAAAVLAAAACSPPGSHTATRSPDTRHNTAHPSRRAVRLRSTGARPEISTSPPDSPAAAMSHRSVELNFALKPGAAPCVLAGYPTVDVEHGVSVLSAEETPRGYLGGLPAGVGSAPEHRARTPRQRPGDRRGARRRQRRKRLPHTPTFGSRHRPRRSNSASPPRSACAVCRYTR